MPNPTLPNYILSVALINILKGDKCEEVVKETADHIDQIVDERFKDKSEKIQEQIIISVLLPLCAELMKEEKQEFVSILSEEASRIQKELNSVNPYL